MARAYFELNWLAGYRVNQPILAKIKVYFKTVTFYWSQDNNKKTHIFSQKNQNSSAVKVAENQVETKRRARTVLHLGNNVLLKVINYLCCDLPTFYTDAKSFSMSRH